jgi:acyl carrier protein
MTTAEDSVRLNELRTDLAELISTALEVEPQRVTDEARLDEDLGIDSLTLVEIVVAAEDRFGLIIPDDDWSRFQTVGDLVTYLAETPVLPR